MRIALIIERFLPAGGGVEGVAWQIARGLAAAGDEVHVFARDGQPCPEVELHHLRTPATWHPLRILLFSRAAARAAPRGTFDIVQSLSRTRHQDIYRAGGGSHSQYLESAFSGANRAVRYLSPRHRIVLQMERKIFGDQSQHIVCNSEMVRSGLKSQYKCPADRCSVIPNGVDLLRFSPDRRVEARKALRRELEGPIWLFLGSGFRRKGLDTAFRAISMSKNPKTSLWVVGRDKIADWKARACQLGVEHRVVFLGERSDPERLYAAVEGFILPTHYDAFANASLEAAATGLPIITSKTNGAADWLGEACIQVESANDAHKFALALDSLEDARTRESLGAAARSRAEKASWAVHIVALRSLYNRLKK